MTRCHETIASTTLSVATGAVPPTANSSENTSAAAGTLRKAATAAAGATRVVCLAFPLEPPARKGSKPSPSRLSELEDVKVPVLVVQGESDRFGMPPPGPDRTVVQVPGDHGLKKDVDAVASAVRGWLAG